MLIPTFVYLLEATFLAMSLPNYTLVDLYFKHPVLRDIAGQVCHSTRDLLADAKLGRWVAMRFANTDGVFHVSEQTFDATKHSTAKLSYAQTGALNYSRLLHYEFMHYIENTTDLS